MVDNRVVCDGWGGAGGGGQAGRVVVTSRGPDGLSVARPGLELVLVAEDGTERRLDRTLDAPGVWSADPVLTEGARARVEARGPAGALLGARDVVGPPEVLCVG